MIRKLIKFFQKEKPQMSDTWRTVEQQKQWDAVAKNAQYLEELRNYTITEHKRRLANNEPTLI
jgi:hypothetical protein